MPASKAVLRDIADLGLDPSKPHRSTSSNGRLRPEVVHVKTIELQPEVKALEVTTGPVVQEVASVAVSEPTTPATELTEHPLPVETIESVDDAPIVDVTSVEITGETVEVVSEASIVAPEVVVEEPVIAAEVIATEVEPEAQKDDVVVVLASSKKLRAKKAEKVEKPSVA